MGLAGQELSEDEMVRLMLQEPKLVRRPMIRVGDQLFVGGGAAVLDSVIAAAK
jgi:arsenate reductase-like glutaredoxin family protein